MTQAQASEVMTPEHRVDVSTARVLAGAGIGELVAGAGAVVLPIVALAGILPDMLLSISALAVGGALLFEGGAVASRYQRLLTELGSRLDLIEIGGGLSAEFIGGCAGIVLGLVALLGVHPNLLMPIAAIVYGGTFVIGAGMTAEMRTMTLPRTEGHETVRMVARSAISTAAGMRVLAGLGAIVLGILGLIVVPVVTLSLVAFLGLGGALLLSGTAIGGKMLAIFQH
jgi:hypothetical protein